MPSSNYFALPVVLAGLPAVLAGAVFLYIGSSPWLVWHTIPDSDHKLVIFSPHVPALPEFTQAQYFTSLPERWVYVARNSSLDDWRKAVVTLSVRPVPLHPAGLLASPRWFGLSAGKVGEPTLVMATSHGKQIRVIAGPRRMGRVDVLTTEDVLLEVPGAAVAQVTQAMHDAWNKRLHQVLGFTATAPDILKELATYDRVFMSMEGQKSVVGMVSESAEQRERWKAAIEAWVVEEDRFRRPRENIFRLPDRSLGRETLAGLPREIFRRDNLGSCEPPLPDAPVFYSCQAGDASALANYSWRSRPVYPPDWRVALGPEFLTAVPGLERVVLQGGEESAAGVVVVE